VIQFSTGYYFALKPGEMFGAILASLLMTVIVSLVTPFVATTWIFLGVAFSIFVLMHMALALKRCVVFLELICFIACINIIVAPWLSYFSPASFDLFQMWVPMEKYFPFVVPATIALWLGMHLPLQLKSPDFQANTDTFALSKHDRQLMDGLIVVGILFSVVATSSPTGFGFVFYILSQLKFVGALSLMITNTPRWKSRVAFVYVQLFLEAISSTLFYECVLWGGYLFICLGYLHRWRWKVFIYITIVLVLLTMLNDTKAQYRQQSESDNLNRYQKLVLFTQLILNYRSAEKGLTNTREVALGDRLVRWNQGWIVSRILMTVPAAEPYAHGETILDAVKASLIPRIFAPKKTGAGSKEIFNKYTGLELSESTSMALGISGEMYANFGVIGGIIGTFFYGLLIGLIFSKFANLAHQNVIWWAWAPFILIGAFEAEWNLVDTLNYIVKSSLVMLTVIYFFPPLKRTLFKRGMAQKKCI